MNPQGFFLLSVFLLFLSPPLKAVFEESSLVVTRIRNHSGNLYVTLNEGLEIGPLTIRQKNGIKKWSFPHSTDRTGRQWQNVYVQSALTHKSIQKAVLQNKVEENSVFPINFRLGKVWETRHLIRRANGEVFFNESIRIIFGVLAGRQGEKETPWVAFPKGFRFLNRSFEKQIKQAILYRYQRTRSETVQSP